MLALPRCDLLLHSGAIRQPLLQALVCEHGKFALDHVQLTARLGRVIKPQTLQQTMGFAWRKGLRQRYWCMSIEIVDHNANAFCLRIICKSENVI